MNPILLNISSSSWLLHSENSEVYGAILVSLLKGNAVKAEDYSKNRKLNRSFVLAAADSMGDRRPINAENLTSGSIAVIPIQGEIMKDDQQCGPRGSASINADIKSAETNPNIKSILLKVNSPGGQTSFTDLLSETITKCKKPVVAYVEGIAASAAYWIISGADKIICSSDLDTVGSIGTMLVWADMKPYLEKEGIKVHEVYATLSTEKNQDIADLRAGNDDAVKKSRLDPINKKFHCAVTANRPALDPSTLKGKIYLAGDAITMGLVDEIGSFDYALQQANSIESKNSSNSLTNTNNSTMKIKMLATWTAIATFFHFTGDITSQELTEEMVSQVNDKLNDLTTDYASAVQQVATLTLSNSEKSTALEHANAKITALESGLAETTRQFDAFKASDFGKETTAGKSADRSTEQIASDQFLHNKIADEQ